MRAYVSIFRIRFINGLQYRAVVFGEVASRLAWVLMEILAFHALYQSGKNGFSMDFSQTASYIWMQQIFYVLFKVVFGDEEIVSSIAMGSIAYELVRPVSLYGRWFFHAAAVRAAFTLTVGAPAMLIAFFIPDPYGLRLPADIGQLLLFLLSSAAALGVVASFAMLMYIFMFYTLCHRGLKIIVTAVTDFFSGGIIPLPFFPEPVLKIVELLPFTAMRNIPLLIYNGSLMGAQALERILFQLLWLAVLVLTGVFCMRKALQKVIVQGG